MCFKPAASHAFPPMQNPADRKKDANPGDPPCASLVAAGAHDFVDFPGLGGIEIGACVRVGRRMHQRVSFAFAAVTVG
jgi:hypothetical protein